MHNVVLNKTIIQVKGFYVVGVCDVEKKVADINIQFWKKIMDQFRRKSERLKLLKM